MLTERSGRDVVVPDAAALALANLAAAAGNHHILMDEGAFSLCMDLVVSNSAEVQQQACPAA